MKTYVILRRGGWPTAADLDRGAGRSSEVCEQMPDEVRWIRSYVLEEPNGEVGTVCIYEASGPEAIRRHAPKLAFIQLLTAGYDHVKRQGLPVHVTLCNAGEAYASSVAAHAIALLLAFTRATWKRMEDQFEAARVLGSRLVEDLRGDVRNGQDPVKRRLDERDL